MLPSTNAKVYKKISKTTSRLINTVTDLKESSENHEACKEYALSQFDHHRYLDVDGYKVERRLKGLCEKFTIHSQPEKSEILKNLKDAFLETDISDTSKAGSQIHYALLLILLNLSKNPVNVDYVVPIRVEPDQVDKFDWAKYLLDGEDMPYPSQWACNDTPYGSEDEEEFVAHKEKKQIIPAPTDKHSGKDDGCDITQSFNQPQNLVPQYWKSSTTSTIASTTLFLDSTTLDIPNKANMSEMNVIREVLWLLAGGTNLFVFSFINGKHTVTDEVVSSHATPTAFKSALLEIAKYGDIIHDLSDFVFATMKHDCQTYQAFAEALLAYIKELQNELKSIERRVLLQEETLLVGDLIQSCLPGFLIFLKFLRLWKTAYTLTKGMIQTQRNHVAFLELCTTVFWIKLTRALSLGPDFKIQ